MKARNLLTEDKEKTIIEVLKLHNKSENDLKNDMEILRSWLKTQKHLPEIPNDNMIMNFLLLNKFSIELSKEKLDMLYTIRGLLPEIFQNKHPRLQHMKELSNTIRVCLLPKLMENYMRVQIYQFKTDNVDKFDWNNFLGYSMNIAAVRADEDVMNRDVLVYDLKNFTAKHITKITPLGLKKGAVIVEKVYRNRIAQIHFLNCPAYADAFLSLIKTVLKPKLAARIHVHKGIDTLVDFIPRNVLPVDYGGEEISVEELEELWTKKFEEYYDRFDELEKMKVNESLRPTPLVNDDILGFHGNFKKLSVD